MKKIRPLKEKSCILKFLLLFGLLNTLLFADTLRLDSIEKKNNNLEQIVAEQKLDLKLKDKDIEFLKNEIGKLTSKLDDKLIDLKTYNTKIDAFDKRISDINFYFIFWGALITIIMAFMIFRSTQEAKQAIQEWIDKEAQGELKSKIDKHIKDDKKEYIANLIEDKIENSVSIEIENLKAIIEDLKNTSKKSKEELDTIKQKSQEMLKEIKVSKENIDASKERPIKERSDEDYYNLGVEALNKNSYNEAIFNFKQALKHHNKFAKDKIYFALGLVYSNLKEYKEAIEAYKKAIEINPQKDEAYYNMGIAHAKLKEYNKAIEAYKKAIEINPQRDGAYTNLFELQLTQNQPFGKKLEEQYLELFSDNKESKIIYDMLKVFESIVNGEKVELEAWRSKYKGVSLGGWSFSELRAWIDQMKERETEESLLEALRVFEDKL